VIHLNHAGTSWPKPAPVGAAMQQALQAEPDRHASMFTAAHAAIAAGLGLPHAERLLLTSSCTQALSILLADLPWRAGDVVLTSSLEHHALMRPLWQLVEQRGVEHVMAPYRPDQPIDLEVVAATLRTGRVRLLAVTGASNVTGERLPLAELGRLAHAHGARFLLDTAQLAGVVPFDVQELGVDLLVFAGHKGLLGSLGIGGLWAAPDVQFRCASASCELGSAAPGEPRRTAPFPGFCDVGSVNLPAACGLAAALAWQQQRTAAERELPMALAAALRRELRQRPAWQVLGGQGPHTATVALRSGRLPLAAAEAHFLRHGIVVRAGSHCAPSALAALRQPAGVLRLSFGAGNSDADLASLLAAIDAVGA
jgi:cysteine desulfurase / selenocysteine lyase